MCLCHDRTRKLSILYFQTCQEPWQVHFIALPQLTDMGKKRGGGWLEINFQWSFKLELIMHASNAQDFGGFYLNSSDMLSENSMMWPVLPGIQWHY